MGRSRQYLEAWDAVGSNAHCEGVAMIKAAFEGQPALVKADSDALLKDAKAHMGSEGVVCRRLETGQCELANFLVQRAVEQTAVARVMEEL